MSNVLRSKSVFGVTIVAAAVVLFAMFATTAFAAYTHTVTLRQGSTGSQVMALQQALGVSADGQFGPITKAAVMSYQASHGLTADGVVGPMTGASLSGGYSGGSGSGSGSSSALCPNGNTLASNCTVSPGGGSSSGGSLSGGAGSINVTANTNYASEDPGEGEDEVGVLSFDVEAEDSDVQLTAVKVQLHQGTAADSEDLTDYLTSVQVFLGDDMVGEEDIGDFSEENDVYTKTIGLSGAVINEDDEEEVSVRVSILNSIDSADRDTAVINVGVSSIRFRDGDGVTSTDSFTLVVNDDAVDDTLEQSFTIGTFATAADLNFKITKGADWDDVNDAHVIDIHATDETTNVPILSVNVEIEGDSDVTIDSLPVRLTVGGAQNHVEEMVSGISLWMDGDEVGEVSMTTDCVEDGVGCGDVGTMETYFFDDLDLTLEAGEDYEFLVKVDIYGDTDTPGDVAPGDTLAAQFGEAETDLAQFSADDEAGDELADGDTSGTVTGSASEVRDVGLNVALVSATAVKTAGNAQATQSDAGLFTITFDVSAFGGDIFIDKTAPDATGSAAGVGTETDLNTTPPNSNVSGSMTCTITSPTGATEVTNSFRVDENQTERFAITCDTRDGTTDLYDAFFDVSLTELLYALTDVDGDLGYTFNLEDFKTPQIFLDDNGA